MTAPEDQNGLREALDAETIELAVERVICLVEAFTRAQEKEWESQTPRIWDQQVAAQDRLSLLINAVVNRATAAEAEITRLKEGMEAADPRVIAAAWKAWHARHGGKLGPGPAFVEAIRAGLVALATLSQEQP